MARSVGLKKDLRLAKKNSYAIYDTFNLKSFCGHQGDSYDRFLIRMLEMGESLNIINKSCTILVDKFIQLQDFSYTSKFVNKFLYTKKKNNVTYSSMEDLISHFVN